MPQVAKCDSREKFDTYDLADSEKQENASRLIARPITEFTAGDLKPGTILNGSGGRVRDKGACDSPVVVSGVPN